MTPPTQDSASGRQWLVVAVVLAVVASSAAIALGPRVASVGSDPGASADPGDPHQDETESTVLDGNLSVADANATFLGQGENDTFGAALANVGDVNGDGVPDVAVGAPRNDTGGPNAGAVYVFFGPVNASTLNASQANVTVYGNESFSRAGASVAGADVDGDNVSELVVGAPADDEAGENAGAVYVLDGGESLEGNVSLANASVKLLGEAAGDRAGRAVDGVGNRSDGVNDSVLIGAPRNDAAGENAGAAYLVNDTLAGLVGDSDESEMYDETEGAEEPAERVSLADADATLLGEGAGDLAGRAVSTAGDFDGNGTEDFVVGAFRNDSTGESAGAAYVVTADDLEGETSLGNATVKLAGAKFRDGAGFAVADAGDVNNDSYGDVVVGAPFNDSNGNQAGAAYVVTGGPDVAGTLALNASALVLSGDAPRDLAGWSVSSAGSGDVTCDEYDDVIVGAPGNDSTARNAGAAYVVAGDRDLDREANLSTATATIAGAGADDRAGYAVSDVGNATANDTEDLVVGAPFNDTNANDSGAAYLFDGQCVPPERQEPTETTTKTTTTTEKPTTTTEKPTTTTTERPQTGDIRKVACEKVKVVASNVDAGRVTVLVLFEDGSRTTATAKTDADGDFADYVAFDNPESKNVTRVKLYAGYGTSGERLADTGHIDVTCREPEPEPAGSIREVTCSDVSVLASNVDAERVTVQVRFQDGSTTTATAAATDGEFDGRIAFENPDYKDVVNVRLYAGGDTSGELLDDTGQIEVSCEAPAPEPTGSIGDVNCENVSVHASNVDADRVTVVVRYEDGSTETAAAPVDDDGTFSGTIGYENPNSENVTGVSLYAGDAKDGELLDRVTGINVDCREPEPAVGNVTVSGCEELSLANPASNEATLEFTLYAPNGSTIGPVVVEPGENRTLEGLDPGEYVVGVETTEGPNAVLESNGESSDTFRVAPCPTGTIEDVSCDAVAVDAEHLDEENVTVEVQFADGSTTTATAAAPGGEFDGIVEYDNPMDKNVTNVTLYGGNETTDELLNTTGEIDVTCREPEPPEDEEFEVYFFGCGNVELAGDDDDFPVEVRLVTYNPGQGELSVGPELTLEEGERPGSPGGMLVGILTEEGDYINPNFDPEGENCSGAAGNNPAEGVPGDPTEIFEDDEDEGDDYDDDEDDDEGYDDEDDDDDDDEDDEYDAVEVVAVSVAT